MLALAGLAGCGGDSGGADPEWPQWRGPNMDGVASAQPLPVAWTVDSPNVRWSADVPGVGNSSPIVYDGRVFVTYAHRGNSSGAENDIPSRSVLAASVETGQVLWTADVVATPEEAKHRTNTLAAPTPVADGDSVYVYFGSDLARLGVEDGAVKWRTTVDADYAEFSRYGAASSPVLTEDAVVIFQDREWARTPDDGWLAAFDRETGDELWRTEWLDTCCSYATPVVVDRGAGEEILVAHSGALRSYSARDGEFLWGREFRILQMVGTPVVHGDLVAIAGGAHNVRNNLVLKLTGAGEDTVVDELWSDARFAPQNASPVIVGDVVFAVTDQGIFSARDLMSGDVLYRERLGVARNRASLVAGDGKIYVQSTSGLVSVLAAGREYDLLAQNRVSDQGANATPAVGGGCLILRSKRQLHCVDGSVEWQPPPGASAASQATGGAP